MDCRPYGEGMQTHLDKALCRWIDSTNWDIVIEYDDEQYNMLRRMVARYASDCLLDTKIASQNNEIIAGTL